ncbi:MAG: adenylate/guanylate cyclase domain-containing protein [Geminicoccaceae bacterium]
MAASHADRRIAAVLAADVVGYSALMEQDEDRTVVRLKAHRAEFINPLIAEHHGRIVDWIGDGTLCEFASIVDAVRCAVLFQQGMTLREKDVPAHERIRFRIGVNLGDIIHEENGDLFGDAVNLAARLEQLADPGGVVVSGTAYDHLQGKIGVPLEFMGEQRVKNIERPVRAYRMVLTGASARGRHRGPRRRWPLPFASLAVLSGLAGGWWFQPGLPPLAAKSSIAVLPFANVSGAAIDDYLADGITDDLITDLAQLSGLVVIGRNSVFGYKDRPIVLREVARELGVRYALEGSVRRSGEQLRVNVQLTDATTGTHLWANRFERHPDDVLAVQDEVIRHVVATLAVNLTPEEQARLARPPTQNLEAYDYYLRAERAARSSFRPDLGEALTLYEQATKLDPSFADAYAAYARTAAYIWRQNWDDILPGPVARKQALEAASRALQLNPAAPLPYAVLAVLQVVGRQYEDALASARQAVALAPSDAQAYAALGLVLAFSGEHAEAAAAVDRSLRIDPMPPTSDAIVAGLAFSLNGDHGRAIEVLERARTTAPLVDEVHAALAVVYAAAGRIDDARAAIEETLRLGPILNVELYRIIYAHFRYRLDLERILDALRRAGLPEWPYGFRGDEAARLDGGEITRLAFGHTWEGQAGRGGPALLQFTAGGQAAYREQAQIELGVAFVKDDMLCERSETVLSGRTRCGPVYRQPQRSGAADTRYTYVNAFKLFHFSQVR